MSSRKRKRFLSSIGITLACTAFCFLVIIVGGKPIINMAKAHGLMVIKKGAPSYPNEYDMDVYQFLQSKGTDMVSEIQVPSYGTHYGNIYSERINLEAPIYMGDSESILLEGVGHYTASGMPGGGKPILIGGHDITFFAPLEWIEPGDMVTLKTNYGQFEYKVTKTLITDPLDTTAYDLSLEKEQLILYTCYPFGQVVGDRDRFFVYCEKVDANE